MLNLRYILIFIFFLMIPGQIFAQNSVKWVISLGVYENIQPWGDYWLVRQNQRWGILNKDLQIVVAPRFAEVWILNDWAIGAAENGKWGFLHINNLDKWAIEPQYTDLGGWDQLYAAKGRAIIQHQIRDYAWKGYLDGKAQLVSADKTGVMAKEWEEEPVIMDNGYPPDSLPTRGPKWVTKPWHKNWKSVTYLIDPHSTDEWGNPSIVRHDVYVVEESLWHFGVVDSNGHVLLPAKYMWIQPINLNTISLAVDTGRVTAHAYALFRLPDCKRMSKGEYQQVKAAGQSNDSPIIVTAPFQGVGQEKRYGLLSPAGEEWIPCEYQDFREDAPPTFIPAKKNGQWGLIDMKNRILLPFEYDAIRTKSAAPDTEVLVSQNGKAGMLKVY